jgi:hypothetical protein
MVNGDNPMIKRLLLIFFALLCIAAGGMYNYGSDLDLYDVGMLKFVDQVCSWPSLHEYWPLTTDATGACNGIDLTASGDPVYGADGADLDGNDYLYTDTNFSFGDDITIIAFVKCDECTDKMIATQYDYHVDKKNREWVMSIYDANQFNASVGLSSATCGDSAEDVQSVATITENGTTQYMVVFRADDTDDDVFLDVYTTSDCASVVNVEDTTMPSDNSDCFLGTERFAIGALMNNGTPESFWDGDIKSVMVFSGTDVLSDARLVEICNAYK